MSPEKNNKGKKAQKNEELTFSKIPPQNIEIEQAVLGAMMVESRQIDEVLDIITNENVFYSDVNKKIFAVIRDLYLNAYPVDFLTVSKELKKRDQLELIGGNYHLTSLTRDVVGSAHIQEHSRILVEKFIKRELIVAAYDILKDSYGEQIDTFDILNNSANRIEDLAIRQIKKDYSPISEGASKVLAEVHEMQNKKDEVFGVPTGFTLLDHITNGWQKGNLIIIAARPSVGKTAFALNLLLNAVLNSQKGFSVMMFSLEMTESELIKRLAANFIDISGIKIKDGKLNQQELEKFTEGMFKIQSMKIFIDDSGGINSNELKVKVKKAKRKHNISMVIVDYLQLMKGSSNHQNREQEISSISRELKSLAKDAEIPIIALSQLNRSVDTRSEKNAKPKLADLRESGAIEQDADIVIFLSKTKLSDQHTSVTIAKNRHGKIGEYAILFDGEKQRFSQMMTAEEDYSPRYEVSSPAKENINYSSNEF